MLLIFTAGLVVICSSADHLALLAHKDSEIQRDPRGPTGGCKRKCENNGTCETPSKRPSVIVSSGSTRPSVIQAVCKCKQGYTGAACETETQYGKCIKTIPQQVSPEGVIKCAASSEYQNMVDEPKKLLEKPMVLYFPYVYSWPYKLVQYGFDESPSGSLTEKEKDMVRCGIQYFRERTCIKFEEFQLRSLRRTPVEHMMVTKPRGGSNVCHGEIYRARPKKIEYVLRLPQGCFHMNLIYHELMHLLGCTHVQARNDRDQYIRIDHDRLNRLVQTDREKYAWCKSSDIRKEEIRFRYQKYDYDSIMHYKNFVNVHYPNNITEKVIFAYVVGDENRIIGLAEKPSESDIDLLNRLYQCPPNYSNSKPTFFPYRSRDKPEIVPNYCKFKPPV